MYGLTVESLSLCVCGLSKPPISKSRFCLIVQTGRSRKKVVLLCQKFPIHSCVCVLSVDMWKKIHALSFCHDIGDVPRMTGFLRLGLYKGKKKRFSRRHLGVFGTEKKDVYVCACVCMCHVSCAYVNFVDVDFRILEVMTAGSFSRAV